MEITLKKTISNDDMINFLSCAFCGGIGYWACLDNTTEVYESARRTMHEIKGDDCCFEDILLHILESGENIELLDCEEEGVTDLNGNEGLEGDTWKLNMNAFVRGMQLAYNNGYVTNIEDMDSSDADIIVQYAIFGDIIFG